MVVETLGNRAREVLDTHRDYQIVLSYKWATRTYVTRPPRHFSRASKSQAF